MREFKYMVLISAFAFIGCKRQNSLEINTSAPLKKTDFKIELQVLGSNKALTQVFDGTSQVEVPSGYGENDWIFIYKDSLYANFRHIITNRNDKHDYNYNFYIKNDSICADVDIRGTSNLKKTLTFTSTRKSYK